VPSVCHRLSGQVAHPSAPRDGALAERLATLADPRCRRGKRHPFVAVLLIACSAVVTGARSFVAIDEWATDARVFEVEPCPTSR